MRRANYTSYRGNRQGVLDNVVFIGLGNVEAVLNKLDASIKSNGYATVAEYYGLTGGEVIDGDSEYGWASLINCQITRTRHGYELQMPYPERVVDNTDHLSEAYTALFNDGDTETALEHLEQLMNK